MGARLRLLLCMKPRISMVTLGVNDLKKSIAFYEQGVPQFCGPYSFYPLNETAPKCLVPTKRRRTGAPDGNSSIKGVGTRFLLPAQ